MEVLLKKAFSDPVLSSYVELAAVQRTDYFTESWHFSMRRIDFRLSGFVVIRAISCAKSAVQNNHSNRMPSLFKLTKLFHLKLPKAIKAIKSNISDLIGEDWKLAPRERRTYSCIVWRHKGLWNIGWMSPLLQNRYCTAWVFIHEREQFIPRLPSMYCLLQSSELKKL